MLPPRQTGCRPYRHKGLCHFCRFERPLGTPPAFVLFDEHPVGPLPPARPACPLSRPLTHPRRPAAPPAAGPLSFLLPSTLRAVRPPWRQDGGAGGRESPGRPASRTRRAALELPFRG